MTRSIELGAAGLALDDAAAIVAGEDCALALDADGPARIAAGRADIEAIVASGQTVYGVNTGFGKLARVRVETEQLTALQHNLLRSHAVGVGELLPRDVVRLALTLRASTLARGASGVRQVVVDRLIELFNKGLTPAVPEAGSVGACGDLAPLAHLALPITGEGELLIDGRPQPAAPLLAAAGFEPITLTAKEGLALINGTQISLALFVDALRRASVLVRSADLIAAMTAEALHGTDSAFGPEVIGLRPHPGALATADNLRRLMADSPVRDSHRDCDKVQDPYSIRCVPQVHGASRDALAHAVEVARRELASVTDNPLLIGDGRVVSAGNFHGQPLALAADYAGIALAELANISACRIEQLVNPDLSGLPAFLIEDSGLNSGLMIAHVAAVSLVSENKVLAHPASVDSIPTSADQEDHVSMSTFAARKCRTIAVNLERVLAIELIAAAQGLDFHRPLASSPPIEAAHALLREQVAFLDVDRILKPDIDAAIELVASGKLLAAAEAHVPLHKLVGA